jgi:hypothetical protein
MSDHETSNVRYWEVSVFEINYVSCVITVPNIRDTR